MKRIKLESLVEASLDISEFGSKEEAIEQFTTQLLYFLNNLLDKEKDTFKFNLKVTELSEES